MSGWILKLTGQVRAAFSKSLEGSASAGIGSQISVASRAIRRGAEAVISLEVSIFIPRRSRFMRAAQMPMMVAMQEPKAAPTKSVGEKDSPLP